MLQHWTRLMASVLVGAACAAAEAGDWPQWRGPHRDGLSSETGLLRRWPKEGPPLVWKAAQLGEGYSSVSVAGGRIFTMGDRKTANGSSKEQYVIALDERTGKELWAARVGAPWGDGGPRSTPTVDGDLLYALGPHGDLVCLATATGKERWRKNLPRDFAAQRGGWGHCESPLVDGTRLVCTPGGKDATVVALNKKTGATIWKAHVPEGDAAAYSSVIVADVDGQREYIQFLGHGLVGVAAKDGTFLWRYDKPANGTANCSTPVYHDARVFAASSYGAGGGLAKLSRDGDTVQAREAYFTKHMQNHHGGMVLVDGYLYGSDEGQLCCLDFKTGKVMWEDHHAGKGSIVYADGHLYYRNEGGPLVLVEANPHKYVEHGRFNQPSRSSAQAWPHPAIANGKLYIRDRDILLCFDVKQH